ncbi:MAG: MFS transporter [Haloarculaceae archaeon]
MRDRLPSRRWHYVVAAAAAMGVAGTYQFVWSSIRLELGARLVASEASLGTVFTVFVVAQTLSQFPAGRFRDRNGPRLPMAVGALLLAVGYGGTAVATEIWQVYVAYAVGGVGAGAVYTVAVNTPIKWFTDRRGLATGVVTMAYGGVSVLFIPVVRGGLAADFTATLLATAAVTTGVALVAAIVLRDPERESDGETATTPSTADGTNDGTDGPEEDETNSPETNGADIADEGGHTWRETIRTWQFWVLYALMVVVHAVGLMIIGKAVDFADQFGLPAAVVTAAASVLALSDSLGIVVIGGLSDRLGRERTVAATVTISGVAIAATVWAGNAGRGLLFVGLLGAAAFFRSPVFSVLPALVGDYYGRAHSSQNNALLYTAKVWGGIGGGVAASLLISAVGWSTAFLIGAAAMSGVGLFTLSLRPVE